jgi:hypothetical protein
MASPAERNLFRDWADDASRAILGAEDAEAD